MRLCQTFFIGFILVVLHACALPRLNSPYQTPPESSRNTARAQELRQQAAKLIECNPDQAECLLREALTFDIEFGPAHNDLGVCHLSAGRYYEAACEFEWARKLMPGHPDPRMNLALTFERAGRVTEALSTYDTALEVYPNHLPTLQALTRLQIRSGQTDDRTPEMLKEIALAGENEQWRTWARRQMLKLDSDESSR